MLLACTVQQNEVDGRGIGGAGKRGGYGQVFVAIERVLAHECACGVEDGIYTSVEECESYSAGIIPSPPVIDCVVGVVDGSTAAETIASRSCEVNAVLTYAECIESSACGDYDAQEVCIVSLDDANCPVPAFEDMSRVQVECYGEDPPFECGDGTGIPAFWECDSEPDCSDGSDEHDGCEQRPTEFVCDDGEVIPPYWVCDGEADCDGGEDKRACAAVSPKSVLGLVSR